MPRTLRTLSLFVASAFCLAAQTIPAAGTTYAGPTYFTNTGIRYSYYDATLTETTNIGVRATSSSVSTGTPQGGWVVLSIDSTPRSSSVTTAAVRIGGRYFLKSAAGGNLILHTEAGVGMASVPATTAAGTSSLQANIQPGVGATWRICHTFIPKATVNCVADFDYDLNWVSSQSVKPLVGVFLGIAF